MQSMFVTGVRLAPLPSSDVLAAIAVDKLDDTNDSIPQATFGVMLEAISKYDFGAKNYKHVYNEVLSKVFDLKRARDAARNIPGFAPVTRRRRQSTIYSVHAAEAMAQNEGKAPVVIVLADPAPQTSTVPREEQLLLL